MKRRSLAILGVVLAAVAGSCAPDVDPRRLPADPNTSVRAAIFLTNRGPEGQPGQSAVALLGRDGAVDIVPVDKTTSGEVLFGTDGGLFLAAAGHSYVLDAGRRTVVSHPDLVAGQWAGELDDGTFASIHDGVVTFTRRGRTVERDLATAVDAAGLAGGTVYARVDDGGTHRLVGTTASGRTSPPQSWRTWGSRDGWSTVYTSDLFAARGRLWYLEDVNLVDGEERATRYDGVHRTRVRLASVDPRTGDYRSRPSAELTADGRLWSRGGAGQLASASLDSALVDDALWWLTNDGRVMATSLDSARSREVCRLPQAMSELTDVALTWSTGRLDVVGSSRSTTALHEVDLGTCRVRTTDLPGLHEVQRDDGPMVASSLAMNPRLLR